MNTTLLGVSVVGIYVVCLIAYAFNPRVKEENRVPELWLKFSMINCLIGAVAYLSEVYL